MSPSSLTSHRGVVLTQWFVWTKVGKRNHCFVDHCLFPLSSFIFVITHLFSFLSRTVLLWLLENVQVWLEEQCERTVTSFYQNCKTGDTYYLRFAVIALLGSSVKLTALSPRCHRSGKCVPKGKIRVSSTKKTVRNCTCHLNVYLNVDGSIAVKGCFGHVGHSLDAALLRITKPQEIYLKTLLQGKAFQPLFR